MLDLSLYSDSLIAYLDAGRLINRAHELERGEEKPKQMEPVNDSFFLNKSIALVGAVPFDADISKCDYIAHVNQHWLNHQGRVDIWVHNSERDAQPKKMIQTLEENRDILEMPKLLLVNPCQTEIICLIDYAERNNIMVQYLPADQYQGINPLGPELEWANCFRKRFNFRPFTGILALEYFRTKPVKSIFVTGMNLYHENGERPRMRGPHDIEKHILYLKEVQKCDARVTFDEMLLEVINSYCIL